MLNIFSVHYVSLVMVGLSIIAVFTYIPLVSEFAFWFALAAYLMLGIPAAGKMTEGHVRASASLGHRAGALPGGVRAPEGY